MRHDTLSDGRQVRYCTIAELEKHWGTSPHEWEFGGPVDTADGEIRFIETERGWQPERYDDRIQAWYACDGEYYTDADLPV